MKVNIIRACSEALIYAVAKCFQPENVFDGFKESFYPKEDDEGSSNTKLMITVLNGGKAVNSLVKWAKFYLIIDTNAQHEA